MPLQSLSGTMPSVYVKLKMYFVCLTVSSAEQAKTCSVMRSSAAPGDRVWAQEQRCKAFRAWRCLVSVRLAWSESDALLLRWAPERPCSAALEGSAAHAQLADFPFMPWRMHGASQGELKG